ncbi:MAG: hypothetical protein C4526_06825 [Nitrospiraceae bacterium]|nr:MAG: hypothetical protein C4526_06825 [Nitrospiraceae bacterium]
MKVLLLAAVIVLLILPARSPALTLDGESKTYFRSEETVNSKTISPVFEYLEFIAEDPGREEVSFHFGGWARYKGNEEEGFSKKLNSDLQYAYLSFRRKTDNDVVNLGRLFVSEGVALEQIDGVYKRTDLKGGFGVAAFGGVPVETDFDRRDGDLVYGARLTHETGGLYRAGLSYLKERNENDDFREEGGLDISLFPVEKINILGRSSYNIRESGMMEHSYFVALGPFEKFRITPEIYWADYRRYFTSPTTNAFVFQDTIDLNDEVIALGGEASYSVDDNLLIAARYKNFNYDIAGNADYYGGRLAWSVAGSGGAGLSVYRMSGEADDKKYTEYRAYGYKSFGKTGVTVDLFDVSYDKKINDVKNAYAAVVAAGYDLSENVRVAADLEYGRNPFFDDELKLFLKLLYRFGDRKTGV